MAERAEGAAERVARELDPSDPAQTKQARTLLTQYLHEARVGERSLAGRLRAHLAVTPRGSYRSLLEDHLAETRQHEQALSRRLRELRARERPGATGAELARAVATVPLELGRLPLALLRPDGAQRLVRNAEAECAAEARQMAGYDAIETLARALDDLTTARLASQHRAREGRMLDALRAEIATLTANAVLTRAGQEPVYERAGRVRRLRAEVAESATEGREAVRMVADTARRLPGVEAFEGRLRGAAVRARDLPIADYDVLNVAKVTARLPELSQAELGTVAAYERRHRKRTTVLERIASLREDEPWAGYDALTATQAVERLRESDEDALARVRDYEGRHRQRDTVLSAIKPEVAKQ
jgi:hypothetical protein